MRQPVRDDRNSPDKSRARHVSTATRSNSGWSGSSTWMPVGGVLVGDQAAIDWQRHAQNERRRIWA